MSRVCGKQPHELKIDLIDDQMDKLGNHKLEIDGIEENSLTLKNDIKELTRKFFEFEMQLKRSFHEKSEQLTIDNTSLLDKITMQLNKMQEEIQEIELKTKEKDSVPDTEDQTI